MIISANLTQLPPVLFALIWVCEISVWDTFFFCFSVLTGSWDFLFISFFLVYFLSVVQINSIDLSSTSLILLSINPTPLLSPFKEGFFSNFSNGIFKFYNFHLITVLCKFYIFAGTFYFLNVFQENL